MSEEGGSTGEDKSHDPSPQKIQKSRDQGDVPYSVETTAAATYGGLYLFLVLAAGWTTSKVATTLAPFFQRPDDVVSMMLSGSNDAFLINLVVTLGSAVAPLFSMLAVTALVSIFAQRAIAFSPSKIQPKLSRISIISNAKQKYGPNGLAEFVKSVAKVVAVLSIVLFAFKDRFADLPSLSGLAAASMMQMLQREAIFFIGFILASAAAIAALDLPWRYFQHRNKLMMTLQEVKKEHKESEGDPGLKAARRQKAESIATNRMMQDVPTADIVIVNPTHYAVALKWNREAGETPVCIAKGVDEVAARIRAAAAEAGVPIRRDPPTARSIFGLVEIGQQIKREHYAAVAAAIHYADEMRKKWQPGTAS